MGFDAAFAILLAEEGGYVDSENDPGGATKYGISQRSYPNLDIPNLTIDQAKQIYLDGYWNPLSCDKMPFLVSCVLFCEAVNAEGSGSRGCIVKLLQQTVGATQDGVLGQMTVDAVNAHKPDMTCDYFNALSAMRYASLKEFSIYGKGWLARLFRVYRKAIEANGITTT